VPVTLRGSVSRKTIPLMTVSLTATVWVFAVVLMYSERSFSVTRKVLLGRSAKRKMPSGVVVADA
jgi:hypothetical protein